MSGTEQDDDDQSAESTLALLLRPWHAEGVDRFGGASVLAGIGLAFLPSASRQPAHRPVARMASAGPDRTGARPAWVRDRDSAPHPSEPPSAPPAADSQSVRSFEEVSDAIANRTSRDAMRLSSVDVEFAAEGPHFAARIGALEAARRLEQSARADPPRPDGCFERYRDVVDGLNDETEEDHDLEAGLSAMFNANLMAFDNDGEALAESPGRKPSRGEPIAPGVVRAHPSEDDFGEPPAKVIFL